MTDETKDQLYVTIYHPVCGWKAEIIGPEGPECTSTRAFATPQEAQKDAEAWGEAENLPVRHHEFAPCPVHSEETMVDGNCETCTSIKLRAALDALMSTRGRKA